jgi:hypothetical protein
MQVFADFGAACSNNQKARSPRRHPQRPAWPLTSLCPLACRKHAMHALIVDSD